MTKTKWTVAAGRGWRQRWLPRRPPGDRLGRWAGGSGLLGFLAFPPLGFVPLIFVAWMPLLHAAYGGGARSFGRHFRLGWLGAFSFFLLLLHWILLLANDEVTIPGIMLPALLVMAAYLGLFFGLAIAIAGFLGRRGVMPAELWFPISWTLADYARSVGETAFPWGSFGYALARHPAAIQLAAFSGVWGLTSWIALVNGLLALALRRRRAARGGAKGLALAAVVLALAPVALGYMHVRQIPTGVHVSAGANPDSSTRSTESPAGAIGGPLRFTLLQANTSRAIKWKPGYRQIVVDDLNAKTRQAAAEHDPDLIVWPETAAPVRIPWEPEIGKSVSETVTSIGRWVLVGTLDAIVTGPKAYEDFNAALLYPPSAQVEQRYFKMHLVPFGEITPWKRYLPLLARLDFGQSEFTPGREGTIFDGPKGSRFRVLICFESIFPELAREGVRAGGRYLVNITNDFWFGRSAGPIQHAEMAILRAVENRTPLIRCANSGLSFFVDPEGRVSGETKLFTFALPTADVRPGDSGSFYTRHGDWWILLLLGLALFLAVGSLLTKRAARLTGDVAG